MPTRTLWITFLGFSLLISLHPRHTDGNDRPVDATPKPGRTEVDLNVLAKNIAGAMRTDPNLQGSWLFLEADDQSDPGVAPRLFRLRRVLDRDRASNQLLAMNRLVSRLFPPGSVSLDPVQDIRLPVSGLVAEVQDQLDLQVKLAGSAVSGAYFEESTNGQGLNLVLRGRVANEAQVEDIERVSAAIMNRNPAWARAKVTPSTHSKTDLPVVPSSEATGNLYYGEGLQNFWRGRFYEAAQGFQRAVLENPTAFEYQYWRVVADLSLGNRQRAAARMENLIRYHGAEKVLGERPAVARSLERVQGTFRQDLRRLESEVLANVTNTKRIKN